MSRETVCVRVAGAGSAWFQEPLAAASGSLHRALFLGSLPLNILEFVLRPPPTQGTLRGRTEEGSRGGFKALMGTARCVDVNTGQTPDWDIQDI